MSDVLPPIDELLAEFDSGKVPRSEVWHTLIIGLYFNFDSVNEIENWYNTVLDLTSVNQQLASDIKQQHDQIEIWYGQIDTCQQQVSQNTTLAEQYKDDAQGSATASQQYSAAAKTQADRAETAAGGLAAISNPNLLVNGDFSVKQRDPAPYGYFVVGDGKYGPDRWIIDHVDSSGGSQESEIYNLTDKNYGMTFSASSSDDVIGIRQKIEQSAFNGILGNKTLTLSFEGNSNVVTQKMIFSSHDISGKVIKEVTKSFPKGTYQVSFDFNFEANRSIHYYQINYSYEGGDFGMDWVKLELGPIATPFIPDNPAINLTKCQRYYQQVLNNSVDLGIVCHISTTIGHGGYPAFAREFITLMRTNPSVTVYEWAQNDTMGSAGFLHKIAGNSPLGQVATSILTDIFGFQIIPKNVSWTPGLYWGYWKADAEL